jgi:hypothetical protein
LVWKCSNEATEANWRVNNNWQSLLYEMNKN